MNYSPRTASCSIFSCCFGHSPIPVVIDAVLENKYARNLFGMLQSSYVFIVGSPYCVTPSLKTLQKSLQLNLRLWSWNTTVRCQMAFWNRRIYSSLQTTKEKLCWVLANSLVQGEYEGEKGEEQPTKHERYTSRSPPWGSGLTQTGWWIGNSTWCALGSGMFSLHLEVWLEWLL